MVSRTKIVFVVIVIINFYMLFFPIINENEEISVLSNEGNNPPPLVMMAFVEPIYIDNNWTETVFSYGWCTGSGLYTDPYVIKNVEIDAHGSKTGIFIANTTEYFRIQNCDIYNSGIKNQTDLNPENLSGSAIELKNVRNAKIMQNNCTENIGCGIRFSAGCFHCIIERNFVSENKQCGIHLSEGCYDITILENNVTCNDYIGILLSRGPNDNLICKNNISYNIFSGIYLSENCNYNIISENNISYNENGIIMNNQCYYNEMRDNFIQRNINVGIELSIFCNNNNFTENNICRTRNSGINITSNCSSNFIYNNSFSWNKINAIDDGFDNRWNNSIIGNLWGDYEGIDWNDDGIGDTSYEIFGSAESKDFIPIWDDGYKTPFYLYYYFLLMTFVGITETIIVIFLAKQGNVERKTIQTLMLIVVLSIILFIIFW